MATDDVDEYYASIIAEVVVREAGGVTITALRDLSGRWQRALSVGSPPVVTLPRAVASVSRASRR